MKTIRWGILGVARINGRLIPALRQARNAELVAIASRSLEKARAAAQADAIPVAHGSYEDLLEDPSVDVVYNPLPNSMHAEWTIKAAQYGKHVFCEKPLASNASEAQTMVDACRKHDVRLMEGFMWPHHPRTARLREVIDGDVLGHVLKVTGSFSFPMDLGVANIRLAPELGGGSLMDVGCYPVYAARWVFPSEPRRVFATARRHGGVDVMMNGVLEFDHDRVALFDCGFNLGYRTYLEVVGAEKSLWVQEMWLPGPRATYEVRKDNRAKEEFAVDGADQIVCMVEEFSQAVLEGREPSPGAEEGVKTMRVLDALRQSAAEGHVVAIAGPT